MRSLVNISGVGLEEFKLLAHTTTEEFAEAGIDVLYEAASADRADTLLMAARGTAVA